ncbi:MAG: hypothetical protein RI953_1855 [Pseudomonadota bacterium]|jgi:hypothetical protein
MIYSSKRFPSLAWLASAALAIVGCVPGQYTTAPLPTGYKKSAADGSGQPGTGTAADGGNNGAKSTGAATATAGATPNSTTGTSFAPGVPEQDALKKCLNLWGTTPFKEIKPSQVKVMDVNVGIGGGLLGSGSPLGGLGNIINFGNPKDLEVTSEPKLIILPLSVNVGGSTTFELMNPNGWYCIKAAVGAKSTVNIKLNCSAKLAQSDLGVSVETNPTSGGAPGTSPTPAIPVKVGINDGKTPGGQLGIMVDSSVNLTRVDSSGSANCPP